MRIEEIKQRIKTSTALLTLLTDIYHKMSEDKVADKMRLELETIIKYEKILFNHPVSIEERNNRTIDWDMD